MKTWKRCLLNFLKCKENKYKIDNLTNMFLSNRELNFHIQIERMKREIEQSPGFSTVVAFQIMDVKRFNYLDWESMFLFLKQSCNGSRKSKAPTKGKINAIFRRLDLNADTKLAFTEFAEAIKPVDVYFTDI